MSVFDTRDHDARTQGLEAAVAAARRGDLVVLPTDTLYGVGTDAFSVSGVTKLLNAKGRGRSHSVPVLVAGPSVLHAVASEITEETDALVQAFWPGGLTLIVPANPTLSWDLGGPDTNLAIRMPLHPVALELLRKVGPMAVSGANVTGLPVATTVDAARDQFGSSVSVYLDGGPAVSEQPSTAIDLTDAVPRLVREGSIPIEHLLDVVPNLDLGEFASKLEAVGYQSTQPAEPSDIDDEPAEAADTADPADSNEETA
jgi:tRNA threonylcarbamoyl adenosine modification protein (Sua5/YciO/YrdC/YwlC family)